MSGMYKPIQPGEVTSTEVADETITQADIASDGVGADEIAAGAVGSSEVADNSLTANDLAADSVGASEIAAGAVGQSEIATGGVASAEIQDGTVSHVDCDTDHKVRHAKAWVNFNGTGTLSIRDSYNVTSVTDDGSGAFTINFANALANINYVIGGVCYSPGTAAGYLGLQTSPMATTSVSIVSVTSAGGAGDHTYICPVIHGD